MLILFLIFFRNTYVHAQSVEINATNSPLDSVLNDLKKRHHLQFSFHSEITSNCQINLQNTFGNLQEALGEILSQCNLTYQSVNNVYIINYSPKDSILQNINEWSIKGEIVSSLNQEPLPYSHIVVSSKVITSDELGRFAVKTNEPNPRIKISHLGHHIQDTSVTQTGSEFIQFRVIPKTVGLKEVTISEKKNTPDMPYLTQTGSIRINPEVATFLPGLKDNVLFNMLRLQPGIMASGEHKDDYVIWGSYKGQSEIIFDGITLFNTNSYTQQLGPVNPLLIKNIEVAKGTYNVGIGNRVGGYINILSKSGTPNKYHGELNVSNQAVSTLNSIPLNKKTNLLLGFRQTYFGRLQPRLKTEENEVNINPSSEFRDMNIKITTAISKSDHVQLNLLGSTDQLFQNMDIVESDKRYSNNRENNRLQTGGSLIYNKFWKRGARSTVTLASSYLNSTIENYIKVLHKDSALYELDLWNTTENSISESSVKFRHQPFSNKRHQLLLGSDVIGNQWDFSEDLSTVFQKNSSGGAYRTSFSIKDIINASKHLDIEPGIKLSFLPASGQWFFQPRLNLQIPVNKHLKISAGAGQYYQFINESSITDAFGNVFYFWDTYSGSKSSFQSARQVAAGLHAEKNGYAVKAEGYYKSLSGLSRFVLQDEDLALYTGKGKSKGFDLVASKMVKSHRFFATYSLSKSEEKFDYLSPNEYVSSPQDQRHELKFSTILNFSPIYFALNHVYGSGIQDLQTDNQINSPYRYQRTDVSVLYKFNQLNTDLQIGASLLNAFDVKNVQYNDFSGFPDDIMVQTRATPFTPSIFVHWVW